MAELEESLKRLEEEMLPWSVEEQEQRRQGKQGQHPGQEQSKQGKQVRFRDEEKLEEKRSDTVGDG